MFSKKVKIIFTCVLASILFAVISFVVLYEVQYSQSFYKGIVIDGLNVSKKSYQEVVDLFSNKVDFILKNGLVFNIDCEKGKKELIIPKSFSGLTTDKVFEYYSLENWKQVIDQAYKTGRQGNVWQKIKEQIEAFFRGKEFAFSFVMQEKAVESFIKSELGLFLKKAVPASFGFVDGKIAVIPEIVGEKIDVTNIVSIAKNKLSMLDISPVSIKAIEDRPLVVKDNLEEFLPFVAKLVESKSIILKYKDYSWNVWGYVYASWIKFGQDKTLTIDSLKVEDYINMNVALYIDSPVQDSHFKVIGGKLEEIMPGVAGNVVNFEKLKSDIEVSLRQLYDKQNELGGGNIIVDIETVVEQPKVTKETILEYGIREVVGSATTNFEGGSLDRQHNIETGVAKLNGLLLAPGEEFSAVNAIGEITEEAGFVKEYVIKEGKTQKELGGGLCQIATTLFRLALNTGLPITERKNHHYVISYYGAGLDATIYGPHPDLRFVNDTGNYLLLQGSAENNIVTLEFYGVRDGRVVEISKPVLYNWVLPPATKYIASIGLPWGKLRCTEIAHNGVTADALYTVTYVDGTKKETNFHSVYSPWQKVCLVGIQR